MHMIAYDRIWYYGLIWSDLTCYDYIRRMHAPSIPYKNRSIHSKSVYTRHNWINLCCSTFVTICDNVFFVAWNAAWWWLRPMCSSGLQRKLSKNSDAKDQPLWHGQQLPRKVPGESTWASGKQQLPLNESHPFLRSPACLLFIWCSILHGMWQKGWGLPWRIL